MKKELYKPGTSEYKEKFWLQTILNSTTDLIWSVDPHLNLINANQTFLDFINHTVGWSIKPGDAILDKRIYSAKSIAFWKKQYQLGLTGKIVQVENELEHRLGPSSFYYETLIHPIIAEGEIIGLACHSRDITEKILTTQKIKELNQKLISAQEIAKVGYWETNLKTQEVFWSPEMYRIWEIEDQKKPLELTFFLQSIHPEDRKLFQEKRKEAISTKEKLDVIYRIQVARGQIKHIREIGEIIEEANTSQKVFKGIVQDISELIKAQLELKKSEEKI
jgi:PAS domain-containing protein